jgi:hypothetical protein
LGQLGILTHARSDFIESRDYFLRALKIFRDFDANDNLIIILSALWRLWKESGDGHLLNKVAHELDITEVEVRELFEEHANRVHGDDKEESNSKLEK